MLPRFRSNEARSFIEQGLQDISVSRASQRWGVPVHVGRQPGHLRVGGRPLQLRQRAHLRAEGEDTASALLTPRGTCSPRTSSSSVRHLAGAPSWPPATTCRAVSSCTGISFATIKRCRSRSATSSYPLELIDVYGVDAVRFYLFRAVSFGQDGTISVEGLHERYERRLGTTSAISCRERRRWSPAIAADVSSAPRESRRGRSTRFGTASRAASTSSISRVLRFDLAACPRAQPPRRRRGAVATCEGRRALHAGLDRVSTTSSTACVPSRSPSTPIFRTRRSASWAPSASRSTTRGTTLRPGVAEAADGIEPAQPLFPRIESSEAAWTLDDRHAPPTPAMATSARSRARV